LFYSLGLVYDHQSSAGSRTKHC